MKNIIFHKKIIQKRNRNHVFMFVERGIYMRTLTHKIYIKVCKYADINMIEN